VNFQVCLRLLRQVSSAAPGDRAPPLSSSPVVFAACLFQSFPPRPQNPSFVESPPLSGAPKGHCKLTSQCPPPTRPRTGVLVGLKPRCSVFEQKRWVLLQLPRPRHFRPFLKHLCFFTSSPRTLFTNYLISLYSPLFLAHRTLTTYGSF